jgi:diaminopimelate decarboxylase
VSEVPEAGDQVTLLDEAGREHRFTLHDVIDVDGEAYYLVEAADDPEQVMLLKETGEGLESVGGGELDRVLALLEAEEGEEGVDDLRPRRRTGG